MQALAKATENAVREQEIKHNKHFAIKGTEERDSGWVEKFRTIVRGER